MYSHNSKFSLPFIKMSKIETTKRMHSLSHILGWNIWEHNTVLFQHNTVSKIKGFLSTPTIYRCSIQLFANTIIKLKTLSWTSVQSTYTEHFKLYLYTWLLQNLTFFALWPFFPLVCFLSHFCVDAHGSIFWLHTFKTFFIMGPIVLNGIFMLFMCILMNIAILCLLFCITLAKKSAL